MNKGLKTFCGIIYYIFTIVIGLLLAVIIPQYYVHYHLPLSDVNEALIENRYDDAMSLTEGLYNNEYVVNEKVGESGGLILFESATLYEVYEDGVNTGLVKFHNSYSGFLYGVYDEYNVYKQTGNKSNVVITKESGTSVNYSLLDFDSDGDGTNDTRSTFKAGGLIYLDFDYETYESIKKIDFIDCDGNSFYSITLETPLTYSSSFFIDSSEYTNEFNLDYRSDDLNDLYDSFMGKDTHYKKADFNQSPLVKPYKDKAIRKTAAFIIPYYLMVYLIGDLLVGKRYTISLFKWLLFDVFKIKKKSEEQIELENKLVKERNKENENSTSESN